MFVLFLGKKIGLSEFQAIMNRRNTRSKKTQSPVILLFPKKSDSENVPHSNGYVPKQSLFTCHSYETYILHLFHSSIPLTDSDLALCPLPEHFSSCVNFRSS